MFGARDTYPLINSGAICRSITVFVVNTITNGLLGILKLRLSNGTTTLVNSGSDTICTASQANLSINQPNNCYSYQWKKDGVNFANLNDTTVTITSAGSYLVVASVGGDVITSDTIVIVEEICSNINELATVKSLTLYPNPVVALFNYRSVFNYIILLLFS